MKSIPILYSKVDEVDEYRKSVINWYKLFELCADRSISVMKFMIHLKFTYT